MKGIVKKIIALLILVALFNFVPISAEVETLEDKYELPSSFSWRDIGGIDFSTSMKNQAPAPTCEAYAFVAALETIVQYKVGYPFGCDLSETHLFFNAGGTCLWGVMVGDAADYLIEYGVPDEGCFPDPHRPKDTPFESIDGWEDRTVKITEWGWVADDVESIKRALIEYGPLVVCTHVRRDFQLYRSGVYSPKPWPFGRIVGGHVMSLFGYDDVQQCWLIKNSWGKSWGEEGWIRVAYDAHSTIRPFFMKWYGGMGILYVDGVYGNFMPDVPKVQIESPELYHTYINGIGLKTLLKKLPIQKAAPRIFGEMNMTVNASNTEKVEFYLDGELKFIDENSPYEWKIDSPSKLHTIEVLAYSPSGNISKDIRDIFVFC